MQNQDRGDGLERTIRRRRRMWLAAIGVIVLGAALGLFWIVVAGRDRRSANERLAEIEAARAIPDSENAAMIYNQLLQDPNAISPLGFVPQSVDAQTVERTIREPWLSKDHPKMVAWVKEHWFIIERLLKASRFEECRFSVSIDIADVSEIHRSAPMRQWGLLLSIAANNDIGEGRIDAAIMKWQCVLQMADHLRQQPTVIEHLTATYIGELSLIAAARFVVMGNGEESHLSRIEAMRLPARDDWAKHLQEIRLIEDLRSQKVVEPFGSVERLRYRYELFRMTRATNSVTRGMLLGRSPIDDAGRMYRQCVATARGIRILVILRRYRNVKGRWPESLDEIRSSLAEEMPIDPLNGGSFIYRRASDTFVLYSRGQNRIDENGEWQPGQGDDWPIWPLREKPFGVSEGQAPPR